MAVVLTICTPSFPQGDLLEGVPALAEWLFAILVRLELKLDLKTRLGLKLGSSRVRTFESSLESSPQNWGTEVVVETGSV